MYQRQNFYDFDLSLFGWLKNKIFRRITSGKKDSLSRYGWRIPAYILEDLERKRATQIRILDTDTNTIYSISVKKFRDTATQVSEKPKRFALSPKEFDIQHYYKRNNYYEYH